MMDEITERDLYEERAAILEFEAGFNREEAERLAKLWINKLKKEEL